MDAKQACRFQSGSGENAGGVWRLPYELLSAFLFASPHLQLELQGGMTCRNNLQTTMELEILQEMQEWVPKPQAKSLGIFDVCPFS